MLEIFAPVKELLRDEPVRIDSLVFRLHSRLTVVLLTICAILVSAKQFIGEPISCITTGNIETEPMNAYCWIYSTFTVRRHLRGIPGRDVAAPGVAQALDSDEVYHHRYYQWVCLVLLLQALAFYLPHALWLAWEGGLIRYLTEELGSPFARESWTGEKRNRVLAYFADGSTRCHNFFALRYHACELLNFINSVAQIYMLDAFLEGQFTRYGPAVTVFAMESKPFQRVDPMARLFPKLTKCTIHTFGSTGSTQIHDALCVLPLNVVNEKIFVFMWFWLVFLAIAGALALVYNAVVFSLPKARMYLLQASARGLSRTTAERLTSSLSYGDWFVLRQIASNSNPLMFRQLVLELAGACRKNEV